MGKDENIGARCGSTLRDYVRCEAIRRGISEGQVIREAVVAKMPRHWVRKLDRERRELAAAQ